MVMCDACDLALFKMNYSLATLWGGQSGVGIPLGQGIFLFSKMSRPVLGPTEPPIQWVPWFFPQGKAARA
jgi:hypothetical protein